MQAYLFKVMRCTRRLYSATTHDWVNGERRGRERVRIGGVSGTLPWAPFFFFFFSLLHPEDAAIGGGGRFLSLISRRAPSALIAGSQRQPEVKGEWMGEQHPRRERGEKKRRMKERREKRQCLYRLGYIK